MWLAVTRITSAVVGRAKGRLKSRALARAAEASAATDAQQLVVGCAAGGVGRVVGQAERSVVEVQRAGTFVSWSKY